MDRTTHHLNQVARNAGLGIVADLLSVIVDRGDVPAETLLALTEEDVTRLYDMIIAPAIDAVEEDIAGEVTHRATVTNYVRSAYPDTVSWNVGVQRNGYGYQYGWDLEVVTESGVTYLDGAESAAVEEALGALSDLHSPLDATSTLHGLVTSPTVTVADPSAAEKATVTERVLELHPDALAWETGTEEYDNGYFYSNALTVTTPSGTVTLDPEDIDGTIAGDALVELSAQQGPLGSAATIKVTITAGPAAAAPAKTDAAEVSEAAAQGTGPLDLPALIADAEARATEAANAAQRIDAVDDDADREIAEHREQDWYWAGKADAFKQVMDAQAEPSPAPDSDGAARRLTASWWPLQQ